MMTMHDFEAVGQGSPFYMVMGNFLDEFYRQDDAMRRAMLEEEPDGTLPKEQRAVCAATVHKLANDHHLPVPSWVWKKEYYLADPYFGSNARGMVRLVLMVESPPEFKHRNIFVSRNTLSRA